MGFGAAIHGRSSFIAGSVTAAVAQAAVVETGLPAGLPGDAVWQVYMGGQRLRHCTVYVDRTQHCTEAALPEPVKSDAMTIVDPKNLGRTLTVTRVAGGYAQASGSFDPDTSEPLAATPGHGIWVRRTNQLAAPWHCQVEADGRPRCRSLPPDANVVFLGNTFFYESILGVFTLKDVNVLWISRFSAVHRCTASRAQPEPACTAAKMQ